MKVWNIAEMLATLLSGGSLCCLSPISWRTLPSRHLSVTKAFHLFVIPGSWDDLWVFFVFVFIINVMPIIVSDQYWKALLFLYLFYPTVCGKNKKSCVWVRNVGTCVVFKCVSCSEKVFSIFSTEIMTKHRLGPICFSVWHLSVLLLAHDSCDKYRLGWMS